MAALLIWAEKNYTRTDWHAMSVD